MDERIIHEVFSGIAPIIVGTAIVICITWIVIAVIKAMKQRAHQRNRIELYNRMLDKFGASPEFLGYLQSDEGQKFFEENAVESPGASSPMRKILTSIQIGVIATLFGLGLLTLANLFDRDLGGDLYIVLAVSGTIGLMIGIGFLISTAISYKLCKMWGLLTEKESSPKEAKSDV